MTEFSKFRTALSGFNRSDVTSYVEALCAEHQKQLRQLQEELARANRSLEEETQKRLQLAEELEQAQSAAQTPPEEPEETKELEAYRRAEAMERASAERAAKLRRQMDELLEEASGRYARAGGDLKSLSDDVQHSLQRMEDVFSELAALFEQTSAQFEALNVPEEEKTGVPG